MILMPMVPPGPSTDYSRKHQRTKFEEKAEKHIYLNPNIPGFLQ